MTTTNRHSMLYHLAYLLDGFADVARDPHASTETHAFHLGSVGGAFTMLDLALRDDPGQAETRRMLNEIRTTLRDRRITTEAAAIEAARRVRGLLDE